MVSTWGEADLVDELVHLLDGAGAVRGDEGEGVGADRRDDAALLGLAQAVVIALQLLLDQVPSYLSCSSGT